MTSARYRVEGNETGRVQQPEHCPKKLCHQCPLLLPTLVRKGQRPAKLGGNEGPGRHPSPSKAGPKSFPFGLKCQRQTEAEPSP